MALKAVMVGGGVGRESVVPDVMSAMPAQGKEGTAALQPQYTHKLPLHNRNGLGG
jgi:hypothetical protein